MGFNAAWDCDSRIGDVLADCEWQLFSFWSKTSVFEVIGDQESWMGQEECARSREYIR